MIKEKNEIKNQYPNLEAYAVEYCGYEKNDNDKYGYYNNPNAKWDWYSVGGRWSGMFPVLSTNKEDVLIGRSGVFGNVPEPGCVDVCQVKNLDVNKISKETIKSI